jgi:peptide/nickel transport system permease protein
MNSGVKFSLTLLAMLFLSALLADFIAPYPYDLQNRKKPYHPPTRIHILKDGSITFPYINLYELKDPLFKVYEENKEVSCRLKFFTKTEFGFKLISVEKPCRLYLLGGDKLGRDVFSRLLYGARYSLGVGVIGTLVTFFIGAIVGGFRDTSAVVLTPLR